MKSGRADVDGFKPGALRITRIKMSATGMRNVRKGFMIEEYGVGLNRESGCRSPELRRMSSEGSSFIPISSREEVLG